jgi:SAM-dependent methyltransferase
MARNDFVGRIAERYDASSTDMFDPEMVDPVVDVLAELAAGGPALEFGIGTGRIALPLHRRGVPVHGLDLSADMVAQFRAKPGADAIEVTIGDFASTSVGRAFGLVYLVYNTITNLTTQDEQVACFANAADHLEPGGLFVLEVYIPELQRLPPGETIHPFSVTPTHLGFEEYDVATQIAVSHHYWVDDDRVETFAAPFRYVWPAELDLMARLAGMTLVARYDDWDRSPFTSDSRQHVSVWRKP